MFNKHMLERTSAMIVTTTPTPPGPVPNPHASVMPPQSNRLTVGPTAPPADGSMPKEAEQQKKDYCMLCYKSFGMFTLRYHCRTCGRSCCSDCSLNVKVKAGSYKVCELCDIKNENP